ncbi:unnamed protein product [Gongylonema pulchrum]|uniref:Eukaryotic translation initiation factor 3 30 kDa subunit n=1 Tax=Gongylonema pulchrum TaxID=637853 RepID=A0A183E316_9BILA|nr:unnamed protein product [Gongylonema pulchrum]
MDDDIDGAPIEGPEEETVIKSEPIFEEEDIDGEPIEETPAEPQPKKTATFKQSQWNTVDPSVVASQAVTTSKWDLLESGKDDEMATDKPELFVCLCLFPLSSYCTCSYTLFARVLHALVTVVGHFELPIEKRSLEGFLKRAASSLHMSMSSSTARLDEERRKILREIEASFILVLEI